MSDYMDAVQTRYDCDYVMTHIDRLIPQVKGYDVECLPVLREIRKEAERRKRAAEKIIKEYEK
jgi:hypothetical protein